eukprot:1150255-Pelagomonas_calceolata.AAC.10
MQGSLTTLSPGDVVEVFDGGWWGADVVKVTYGHAQGECGPQEQHGHQQQQAPEADGAQGADAGPQLMTVVAQVPGEGVPVSACIMHVRASSSCMCASMDTVNLAHTHRSR